MIMYFVLGEMNHVLCTGDVVCTLCNDDVVWSMMRTNVDLYHGQKNNTNT